MIAHPDFSKQGCLCIWLQPLGSISVCFWGFLFCFGFFFTFHQWIPFCLFVVFFLYFFFTFHQWIPFCLCFLLLFFYLSSVDPFLFVVFVLVCFFTFHRWIHFCLWFFFVFFHLSSVDPFLFVCGDFFSPIISGSLSVCVFFHLLSVDPFLCFNFFFHLSSAAPVKTATCLNG